MKNRRDLRWLIPALVPFLIATAVYAGGWAIVTVNELPDCVVAGKPVILSFTVRQHGVTLLGGLIPKVRATAAGQPDAKAAAAPTGKSGEYAAALTFPAAGEWTIRIDSGFNAIESALLPLHVIRSGDPSPSPLSPAARGERLFVAKGCIGCHRHQEVAAPTLVSVGPELTGKRFPQDYLKGFLADPATALKRSLPLEYGQMPNLNLKEEEIAALVAFINREKPLARP